MIIEEVVMNEPAAAPTPESPQVTEVEHLHGKRIARVVELESKLGLVFQDGSWCVIEPMSSYGDLDVDLAEEANIHERHQMGLLSNVEYEQFREISRQERLRRNEASDRREYRRLKAKFGKDPGR